MVSKPKRKYQTPSSLAIFFFFLNVSCSNLETAQNPSSLIVAGDENTIIHVGFIVDMGSWTGKVGLSCVSMAISDFYAVNSHYKTRLLLHTRDSRGDPLSALSTAIQLLETINFHAIIIGSETPLEAKLLAELGNRAKVPIVSFLPTSELLSSTGNPYFVQFTQGETSQVKGITSFIETFGWRNVILIYEDMDYIQDLISSLIASLEAFDIRAAHKIPITTISSSDQIKEQLYMAIALQVNVFVVHLPPSLSSLLFSNANELGMMTDGYVWIVTDKTMNFLHTMDFAVIETSMQGVLGFKPYIPPTKELQNFTSRWKREFLVKNPNMDQMELNIYGLWAYDAIWALAMAAERARNQKCESKKQATVIDLMDLAINAHDTSKTRSIISEEMLQSRFKGLSGEIQLRNRTLTSTHYEIINMVRKTERRVGFWTPTAGIAREMRPSNEKMYPSAPSPSKLETIIWPGGSIMLPKRRSLQTGYHKKLKVGVPPSEFKALVSIARDAQTREITATGFCIDVFKAAVEALPYEVDFEFLPFVNADGEIAGTYTDLIDQVYYKNYDAVVGDVTITANRSLYVDFTLPFTDFGYAMLVSKINPNNMWIFLKPLTTGLWLTSAAFCIAIGLVVWVIEHPVNDEFRGSTSQQIGTTLWFAFSILVFAHRERLSSNLSKLVVIVWLFVVLILTSSYTATLASMLTVQQIQSLSSKGTYIGSHAHSVLQQVQSNVNFSDATLKPYGSPGEYADALTRGSKNGGVSAIIDEIPYLRILVAMYPNQYSMIDANQYSMIDVTPGSNGFAFVFRKGSPLVDDMSREIARLREVGKLKMMEDAWFKSHGSTSTQNDPNALSLDSFGGLFIITAVTIVLATSIFFIFLLREKRDRVRNEFRQLFAGLGESMKRFLSNKIFN